MAEEAGHFNIDDVVRGLVDKMVDRHPHVFGDKVIHSADAQTGAWEVMKAAERARKAEQAKDGPADRLYVWRLLVDARHQKRGYGRLAMQWVLEEARRWGVPAVALSHVGKDGHAGPFYAKLGFTYTGEVVDGEHKMLMKLA